MTACWLCGRVLDEKQESCSVEGSGMDQLAHEVKRDVTEYTPLRKRQQAKHTAARVVAVIFLRRWSKMRWH